MRSETTLNILVSTRFQKLKDFSSFQKRLGTWIVIQGIFYKLQHIRLDDIGNNLRSYDFWMIQCQSIQLIQSLCSLNISATKCCVYILMITQKIASVITFTIKLKPYTEFSMWIGFGSSDGSAISNLKKLRHTETQTVHILFYQFAIVNKNEMI